MFHEIVLGSGWTGSGGGGCSSEGFGDTGRSLACSRSVLAGSGVSSETSLTLRLTMLTGSAQKLRGFSESKESSISSRSAGIRTAKLMTSVRRPTPMLSWSM